MNKIYEVAWYWMSEAAVFLVYDEHTIKEVESAYGCYDAELEEEIAEDITEDDFDNYGEPVADEDENIIGKVIDKRKLFERLEPLWTADIVQMMRKENMR